MDNESGQSMIEVIVVASVSILIVMALTFATLFSLRNSGFAKNSAQATKLAQEGIEIVRSARDRNYGISIVGSVPAVTSWNGRSDNACFGLIEDIKSDSIWCYKMYDGCGANSNNCYFRITKPTDPTDFTGLSYLPSGSSFPTSPVLQIDQSIFARVAILSDEAGTYFNQKTLTVIVKWSDVTGEHESKQTTVLRRI